VNLYNYLKDNKQEYVISKQLFKSGTSIGANVFEGKNAQSRADFCNKMNIALKEATESYYWIDLLHDTKYINDNEFDSIIGDIKHIIAVLTKIVKATKT
jgi:four helix bundle protein